MVNVFSLNDAANRFKISVASDLTWNPEGSSNHPGDLPGVIKATLSKSHIGSKPVGRASVTGSSERSKSSLFTKAVPRNEKPFRNRKRPPQRDRKAVLLLPLF